MTSSGGTNRISIFYGGIEYALSGRTLAEVTAEVEAGLGSEGAAWLDARLGQGRSTAVRLLLSRGIPIALAEVNVDGAPAPRDDERSEAPGLG